jgi:hypothetical protein
VILTLTIVASSQRLGKPTLTPSELTGPQRLTLQEGIELHDAKNYREAIAKYRSILAENPNNPGAMYELAMTLHANGDALESVELAYRGTKYISDVLPLFYVLIANNLDDHGKPQEAVRIYQDGLKLLEKDPRYGKYRASLNYNLSITYLNQNKVPEARKALKQAVEDDYSYASPHYLLSIVFSNGRYRIPAFLAASRFVSVEYGTPRARKAIDVIFASLRPAAKDPKTGNTVITLEADGPTDEGDFGPIDMLFGMLTAMPADKGEDRSDNQAFISGVDKMIGLLTSDKKIASTFVGRNYVPFMAEMKARGHIEAFANMIMVIRDSRNQEASKWISSNDAKVKAFVSWAKAYPSSAR